MSKWKKWLQRHPSLMKTILLLCLVTAADGCFAACSAGEMDLTQAGALETGVQGAEDGRDSAGTETDPPSGAAGTEDGTAQEVAAGTGSGLEEASGGSGSAAEVREAAAVVYVDVAGAVERPGVYSLPTGARVYQAIEAAGGAKADAAVSVLNQALVLQDGQQIYVPSEEEAEQGSVVWGTGASASGLPAAGAGTAASSGGQNRININTASEAELTGIPGIGEQKAKAIVQWREANGPFDRIEDIMKVSGIKQAGFDKMKDSITVG